MTRKPFIARSRGAAVAIGIGALLLAGLVVQTGIAGVTRYNAPEVALKWAPFDARALAGSAELALPADATPEQRAEAARLARAAIARDATLGTPFRVLGFVAGMEGDPARAKALFVHAEAMSRRDLPTQVWLIEDAAARFDNAAALRHYDIALRTSTVAPALLFPVLGRALSDDAITDALAQTLAARPSWRDAFLADAIDKSPELGGLVRLGGQLARRGAPLSDTHFQQLLNRLTASGGFGLLARMREAAVLPADRAALVADAGFDGPPSGRYPFGWTYIDAGGLWARRNGDAGAVRLDFGAEAGKGGEIVRQLLTLRPGRYRFAWQGGHNVRDQAALPYWGLACADKGGPAIVNVTMSERGGSAAFTVPAARCAGQWLVLVARPVNSSPGLAGWMDRVMVTRE